MEHDSRSVANELIHRAHDAGRDITPMQVVKLAYYCHAWMLACTTARCWNSQLRLGVMAP